VPIYDYLCASCRQVTEVIHGINDAGPRFCPACGEEATMRKALVSPAVHFKGSGWAKKDRSSTSGTRARSGTGAPADGGSANGGSRDGGAPDGGAPDGGSRDGSARDGRSRDGRSSDAAGSSAKDAANAESGTGSATPASTSED
jgi:putative FmdB family regulatory protein